MKKSIRRSIKQAIAGILTLLLLIQSPILALAENEGSFSVDTETGVSGEQSEETEIKNSTPSDAEDTSDPGKNTDPEKEEKSDKSSDEETPAKKKKLIHEISTPSVVKASSADFTIENDVLTKYNGTGGRVTIPDGVVAIGRYAFQNSRITSLVCNEELTEIRYQAFSGCALLSAVTFNDGLVTIGENAFTGCSAIRSLSIPSSVTSIFDDAFRGCSALRTLTFHTSSLELGNRAFQYCKNLYSVSLPEGTVLKDESWGSNGSQFAGCISLTSFTLGTGTSFVSRNLLNGCTSLKTVKLPDSVTSIHDYAFSGCTALSAISLPASLTTIGAYAFYGCSSLRSTGIQGSNLTKICDYAYENCKSLTTAVLPSSLTEIGEEAFCGCISLKTLTFKSEDILLKKEAFAGCKSLASVSLPSGTSFSDAGYGYTGNQFDGCTSLKTVVFGKGITSISRYAFYGCTSLTNVTLPSSLISIGYSAFENCTSLETLSLPKSLSEICDYAFSGCKKLKEAGLDSSGVTSIGEKAFYECLSIVSLTLPASLTTLEGEAFRDCTALKTLSIRSETLTMGAYAFSGCKSLTSVTIPGGTVFNTYFSRGCQFANCTSLKTVVLKSGITSVEGYTFSGCSSLTSVTFPDTLTSIEYGAFEYCSGLTSVQLPNGLVTIGGNAFYKCTALRSAYIPASVADIGSNAFGNITGLTIYGYSGTQAQTYANANGIKFVDVSKNYTVKFNGNGATSGVMGPDYTMPVSSYKTLPANSFVRKGYTFKSWNTKADGTGKTYADKAKVKGLAKAGKTVTLYARWTANKYAIKFDANGGKGTMKVLTGRVYGKEYTLTANAFTRTGYTFAGWNTKKDGKGTTYKNKASVKNLSTKNGGVITLYAKWTKKKYSITYNLSGGKNSSGNPANYYITTSTITLKNPTRTGYTFGGWYSDSKYKNKVTSIKKGSTGNKTLYAKWVKKKYTITYQLGGGKNSSQNPASYDVTTSTITLKAPSRSGYTFVGWFSDSKYKNKVTSIKKGSTGNKTLYAKWKKK